MALPNYGPPQEAASRLELIEPALKLAILSRPIPIGALNRNQIQIMESSGHFRFFRCPSFRDFSEIFLFHHFIFDLEIARITDHGFGRISRFGIPTTDNLFVMIRII